MTVGTTIGSSVTRGKTVSTTVEASMEGTFKKVFKVGLKTSRTTGYNWSTASSRTFSKSTTTGVWCWVKPGQKIRIEQVVGQCGDSVVHTTYYRCVKA